MVKKLLGIAAKRKWWIVLPTVALGLAACAAANLFSNHYESDATILVAHPKVPEKYVTPNDTGDMREALMLEEDTILSRTQLLQIIDEFNLYPKARKHAAPEDLVD